MTLNILFIGDIVGNPGLDMVQTWLPSLEKKYRADIIIANGENASDGKGLTEKEAKILFNLGVKVVTGGNHTWDKHQSQEFLKKDARSLRPLNYPKGTYGNGYIIVETKKGKVAVLNLQGRAFMATIDCPFRTAEWALNKIKQETKVIFIDFHAEATAEKLALASFLDGQVSVVAGTHTHVQTADERIMPKGTAYITDTGMTGPYDSVIGMKTEAAINRFIFQTPQKYQTASGDVHLCGLFIKVDGESGKALEIERILLPEFDRIKKII
ncbi:MAG: TIGR00282 family metallophosphoesterase [Bacteroidetes bacterium]|nr:TIGR00282 family metallophosphoesterase [Bacteroidota bacterium]MBU1677631.1 TIGR00282 family metallophosphoesterase [Bacteroidota bacterium]MBU2508050.1 TIGR00282 family metallophosphoesterase [Bacteroidota bacterium]